MRRAVHICISLAHIPTNFGSYLLLVEIRFVNDLKSLFLVFANTETDQDKTQTRTSIWNRHLFS